MKLYLSLLICLLFSVNLFAQSSIAPIPGWKMDISNGRYRFTPPDAIGTYGFKYEIFPPVNNKGGDLTEWLKMATLQDLRASGYSDPIPGEPHDAKMIQTLTTYSVIVLDASKKKLAAMYFAYSRPDHSIRYGKVIRLREYAGNDINIAATHFVALLKQETAQVQNSTNTPSAASPQQNTGVSEPLQQTKGKGLSSADIRGIVLHSESSYGVGGMLIFIYKPYVLFNNGSLYEHPDISPNDLNVAQSHQSEPEKWGTWKLNGKTLTIVHGSKNGAIGKPNNWTGWTWAVPAKKGEKLTATYGSISGGGNTAIGGGSITVSSKYITFNNQGQFTYETVGGGSYHDNSGGVSAYSSRNAAGTYLLDGYTIEFRFNNGKVQRQCFYFYNEGDQEIFGIGNRPYTISNK